MVVRKKKKVVKYRGSKTHGGGSMKKRRGAGHRGGRGNAGSGKRADSKKPSFWKNKQKKGFVSLKKKEKTINLGLINDSFDTLKSKGLIEEKEGRLMLDLNKLNITKLLGAGKLNKPLTIIVNTASSKAIEKVKEAKGEVIIKE